MTPIPGSEGARTLLIDMLKEAAKLEHCLLDVYLAAACSLKSTPQEFAEVDGRENRRRAIQFERVRGWKQQILAVAHEEMRHLHYVLCMNRALGERPFLGLPARNAEGEWVIPNWQIQIGHTPYGKDVVKMLADACHRRGVPLCLYYSIADWHQPNYPNQGRHHERRHDDHSGRQPDVRLRRPAGPDGRSAGSLRVRGRRWSRSSSPRR